MKGLYEQTVLPIPFTVLGKRLKPFSFGHYIILRRFGVGFVSDKQVRLTIEDIVFSVYVCSKTFEECKEQIYNGSWETDINEWTKQFGEYEKDGVICVPQIDFEKTALLFNEYITHHTVWPKYIPNNKNQGSLEANAEWFEGILKTLTSNAIGYTRTEALNLCFSEAIYEYLSYMEQQGSLSFVSQHTLDRMEKHRQELKGTSNGKS